MQKNVAGQFLIVQAYNKTTGLAIDGDAANITAAFSLDGGNFVASNDTNPTELTLSSAGKGRYKFDLTQAETNCNLFYAIITSTTEDIVIDDVSIETEDRTTAVTLAASQPNYAPAKAGDAMTLTTAGILAIWHQLLTAIVTEGSVGKLVKDYLDAAITSRSSHDAAAVKTAIEAAGSSLATLLTRLSDLRARYLDNLNVGGLLASQADVAAITQAQRVRIAFPMAIERPDADSTTYRMYIYAYNEQHQAEDLDDVPTVTAENNTGTDRSGNLGTVTKAAGTGIYYVDYTVASTHAIEGLLFKVTATEGTVSTQYAAASLVVDTTAVDFTSADRIKLEAIHGKLPSNAIGDQTLLLAAINAVLDHVDADWYIDTATTPWSLVVTKKGDAETIYCRKSLKDISGGNITDEDTIIASQMEVA